MLFQKLPLGQRERGFKGGDGEIHQIEGVGSGLVALEAKVVRICKVGTSPGQPDMGTGDRNEGS